MQAESVNNLYSKYGVWLTEQCTEDGWNGSSFNRSDKSSFLISQGSRTVL